MKKLISLAMVAAMTVSMVPSTAFAALHPYNDSSTPDWSTGGRGGNAVTTDDGYYGTGAVVATSSVIRPKGTNDIGISVDETYYYSGSLDEFDDDKDSEGNTGFIGLDMGGAGYDHSQESTESLSDRMKAGYIADSSVPELQIKLNSPTSTQSAEDSDSVVYFEISLSGGGLPNYSVDKLNTLLSYNPNSGTAYIVGVAGAAESTVVDGASNTVDYQYTQGDIMWSNDTWNATDGFTAGGSGRVINPGDGQAGFSAADNSNVPNVFIESVDKIKQMRGEFVITDFTVGISYNNVISKNDAIKSGDLLVIDLPVMFSSTGVGTTVNATVECEAFSLDHTIEMARIADKGFTASYYKTLDVVAPEERIYLTRDIDITETVIGSFVGGEIIRLKLSRGFEFVSENICTGQTLVDISNYSGSDYANDEDELYYVLDGTSNGISRKTNSIDNDGSSTSIQIEATTAQPGDIATITIYIDDMASQTIQVAEVVDYAVIMSVDTDKSVPVMYNGVNRDNDGLTINGNQNESLEVTIYETFPGAWDVSSGFQLTLPDGVYVVDEEDNAAGPSNGGTETPGDGYTTDTWTGSFNSNSGAGVDIKEVQYINRDDDDVDADGMTEIFKNAYARGDYEMFDFPRRPFDGNNHTLQDEYSSITFSMNLVAVPGFEGPVELGFSCSGTDDQTVTIAEFVSPFKVTAQQNDVIIDYRNTELGSTIVIEEYEAGLLDTGVEQEEFYTTMTTGDILGEANVTAKETARSKFFFTVDRGDVVQFETGATFNIDENSDMEVKGSISTGWNNGWTTTNANSAIEYYITEMSYDVPATVTIDDIELFMQRSIPAGAYPLAVYTTMYDEFLNDILFGSGSVGTTDGGMPVADKESGLFYNGYEVHSNFVNVITAGSDMDNTFLTSIIVPIDANYIIAGTKIISLEGDGVTAATPPAYISNGYTMVPVRAVSEALSGSGYSVEWNATTKTVSIISPSSVVNMTVGDSVYYKFGQPVSTSAVMEIKEGRTFLPFRDLGKMLGVLNDNINWDESTRTAIINGNVDDIARIRTELGL